MDDDYDSSGNTSPTAPSEAPEVPTFIVEPELLKPPSRSPQRSPQDKKMSSEELNQLLGSLSDLEEKVKSFISCLTLIIGYH